MQETDNKKDESNNKKNEDPQKGVMALAKQIGGKLKQNFRKLTSFKFGKNQSIEEIQENKITQEENIEDFKKKQQLIQERESELRFYINIMDCFRFWIPRSIFFYQKRELFLKVSFEFFLL